MEAIILIGLSCLFIGCENSGAKLLKKKMIKNLIL
jgi:hypothetical protein